MDLDRLRAQFADYHVVLEPDENTPEWWAGAPSVCRDGSGTFWMACRMREGHSPRGMRGYEIRLLRSDDGIEFEPVHSIHREDVPIPGFERPALLHHRETGLFSLYGCGPYGGGAWCVFRFEDATSPMDFVASSARPVIAPEPPGGESHGSIVGYKDPFIARVGSQLHCFVIGVDRVERAHHFCSEDGNTWRPVGDGLALDVGGWHSFYTRPACLLPIGVGHLLIYEGSHPTWLDPAYNIATGLAWSADLECFLDLTPEEPLLASTTPGDYLTWRYSHWLWADGALLVYAEVARPNNTNEIRVWRLEA